MVGAASEMAMMAENVQDLTSLTGLSKKEISMLQAAATQCTKTLFKYYSTGLSLGLSYDMLKLNEGRPKVEMFLASHLNKKHIRAWEFMMDVVDKTVMTDIRSMYHCIDIIKEYEGTPDMSQWIVPEHLERWVEYTNAFELVLFSLATLICALDKLDYENRIEGPEGCAPTAVNLFLAETVDTLQNRRGDINVNEFLFQLGIGVKLKIAVEGSEDVSTWDMCLVAFRALCMLWLTVTKGKPIQNIHLFRDLVTDAVKRSPHSYTLRCIICWFLPQCLYEYGGNKLGWIRDNLLVDWRSVHCTILDEWGAAKDFSACESSNYTGSEEEEEQEEEEPSGVDTASKSSSHPTSVPPYRKCRKVDCDPSCFGISFSPDTNLFVIHIIRSNKFFSASNLDDLKDFEL